jgi:hypothetical protein
VLVLNEFAATSDQLVMHYRAYNSEIICPGFCSYVSRRSARRVSFVSFFPVVEFAPRRLSKNANVDFVYSIKIRRRKQGAAKLVELCVLFGAISHYDSFR